MASSRDYSHRLHYLRSADRKSLPYLGSPEDRMRRAFQESYGLIRDYLRTGKFADEWLDHYDTPERALAYLDGVFEDAQVELHRLVIPTYEKICHGGAALGRTELTDVRKADAAPSFEPRRRRRFLDRRPRLHGLQPTPVPRPVHSFNASTHHIEAANNLALSLVTHVNKSQRNEIRTMVTEAITRGINVHDTSKRVANIVGLFPRWQRAVNNLHARMIDNGIPKRIADTRARDYAEELVQKRGIMIARTELLRAMNTGRWAGWHDLSDQGYLDPKRSVKRWVGSIDHDICEECEFLADPHGDGVGIAVVGIDTPFETDFGRIIMPPAHPHCRCTAIVEPALKPDQGEVSGRADDAVVLSDPEIAGLQNVLA